MRAAAVAASLAACAAVICSSQPLHADGLFEHVVPMREHTSGQYYVPGMLSGAVATEFLVDTGSGFVALSAETFGRLTRRASVERVRNVVGALANGKLMEVRVYRVDELEIGESCRLTDVEVAVLPSGARDILGLSALKRLGPFAIQMSPPELWLSGCELRT